MNPQWIQVARYTLSPVFAEISVLTPKPLLVLALGTERVGQETSAADGKQIGSTQSLL